MTKDEKIAKLTSIIIDTIWMARRYADGRKTFSSHTVNTAIDHLTAMGIKIENDDILDDPRYATDGDFGMWPV